jgi:hypothetical protein
LIDVQKEYNFPPLFNANTGIPCEKANCHGDTFFLIFDFFIPFHNATTHKVFLTFEDLIDIQKKSLLSLCLMPIWNYHEKSQCVTGTHFWDFSIFDHINDAMIQKNHPKL